MEIDQAFILHSVGRQALADVARQAAAADHLELEEWHVEQIGGGLGNPVSVGLFRIAGHGRADGERIPWSAILKVIQSPANVGHTNMGEGDDPTHWNYWRRELYIYRSSFLDALPDGLVAPRCYATQELPGDMACLWFEEVVDTYQRVWPFERYELAARHLGRLNGLYAGTRPPPDYPWLGQRRLRQWYDLFPQWRAIPWEHPKVSARYPAGEIANLRRMLLEAEEFIDRLDRLPQTICHGDSYPTNFMARDAAGCEQTVALDWALAQIGPVGFDLGGFTFGAYLNSPQRTLPEVDGALFAAYMGGLHDSGCGIDERQVRFGYSASAALIISLFVIELLNWQLRSSDATEVDATQPSEGRPCFEAAMADIAYELRDFA